MAVLLISDPRYLTRIRYFLRKVNRKLHIKKFWYLYSGNWHWIKEKPVPIASINRSLWRLSVPSFSFHFILLLSAIIATLGLLSNSAAVIIGAMIVAPLMGPIVGMAYSTAMGNRKLFLQQCLNLSITKNSYQDKYSDISVRIISFGKVMVDFFLYLWIQII